MRPSVHCLQRPILRDLTAASVTVYLDRLLAEWEPVRDSGVLTSSEGRRVFRATAVKDQSA